MQYYSNILFSPPPLSPLNLFWFFSFWYFFPFVIRYTTVQFDLWHLETQKNTYPGRDLWTRIPFPPYCYPLPLIFCITSLPPSSPFDSTQMLFNYKSLFDAKQSPPLPPPPFYFNVIEFFFCFSSLKDYKKW